MTAHEATLLIFGASGDLTSRKLLPALYSLWQDGYLSDRAPIVGVARRGMGDEEFRGEMRAAVAEARGEAEPLANDDWKRFAARLHYRQADLTKTDDFKNLKGEVEAIEREAGVPPHRVVYLAVAPKLFVPSVEALDEVGMIPRRDSGQTLRVVIEKPFGHDLASAREMNSQLGRLLREEQIYRIDHYLGKETVQNILLFRFGNAIFEPLLNRNHVDHVQITVAESLGVEDRGGYYDQAGALRDVLQNHVLQLLCLTAMEAPGQFLQEQLRDEKVKVLRSLLPGSAGGIDEWAVAGQYTAGTVDGQSVPAYREEERVDPDSRRDTFAALEVQIDNWRWAGVPFYLRTGKRMPRRVTEIAIQFKLPPKHLFQTIECEGDLCELVEASPNALVFRIQPHEAISLRFSTKRPGMQYQIHPATMDFWYENAFERDLPEAYERLLLDVLRDDSTLFTRSDELEAAWEFVTPILEHWESRNAEPAPYKAGTWGPKDANELLTRTGRTWRKPTASGPA
jgi:glucose-6-phosphate 1-dehydrogenase